jgi:mRNA interferase RelE/StbE
MKVILHPEIENDFNKLNNQLQAEAARWIRKLGKNPYLGQALVRELRNARKIYFNQAKHRIVYTVNAKEIHVLIIAVGTRQDSEVYRIAKQRMDSLGEGR